MNQSAIPGTEAYETGGARERTNDSLMWLALAKAQADRFWSKVDRSGECWLWAGGLDADGYGKTQICAPRFRGQQHQKHVRAHRLAWALANDRWPADEDVLMHSCDIRACCRPEHVRLGTPQENRADCVAKDRQAKGDRVRIPHHIGEKHPNAKLTEAQVREIRALYATGRWTYEALGRRFGIAGLGASNIVRRRTWRHVE